MKRIAVLLSGRGANFEAIAESVRAGRLPVVLAFALSVTALLLAVSLLWWARGGVRG